MRTPKVKTGSNAARKKRELSEKEAQQLDLAKRVMKGELVRTTLGDVYKLMNIEEDQAARWDSETRGTVIARLVNASGIKIPGRGKTKQEAVVNTLTHLENMGQKLLYTKEEVATFIADSGAKKKKGIPFV